MNTLRISAAAALLLAAFATGCTASSEEDSADDEATTGTVASQLPCSTCEEPPEPTGPSHPDFVVLPGATIRLVNGYWWVDVTIKNQGNAAGDPGMMSVAIGKDGQPAGGSMSVFATGSLGAGQSRVVSIYLAQDDAPNQCYGSSNLPCLGPSLAPYYINTKIDSWSSTYESNENNNTRTINL